MNFNDMNIDCIQNVLEFLSITDIKTKMNVCMACSGFYDSLKIFHLTVSIKTNTKYRILSNKRFKYLTKLIITNKKYESNINQDDFNCLTEDLNSLKHVYSLNLHHMINVNIIIDLRGIGPQLTELFAVDYPLLTNESISMCVNLTRLDISTHALPIYETSNGEVLRGYNTHEIFTISDLTMMPKLKYLNVKNCVNISFDSIAKNLKIKQNNIKQSVALKAKLSALP